MNVLLGDVQLKFAWAIRICGCIAASRGKSKRSNGLRYGLYILVGVVCDWRFE